MPNKQMLFIYNPLAGKANIKNNFMEIIDIFVKAGYEVTVYPTQKAGDAISVTKDRKPEYDIVVCSGGDGTLDEVVTGMMAGEHKSIIGYIPAGSTNDFAGSLSIPSNMIQAAEIVVKGREFLCDVGSFNDDSFVYIAAFGLFTAVSYETSQQFKNVFGHMAYVLEGVKRLSSIKAYKMKVKCAEIEIEDEFIFGMISNSESVGGFKRITGNLVELDDGLFEVTLIKRPKNPIELNLIVQSLLLHDIDTEFMYCFKTAYLQVESERSISWTLDGEFGGKHKKVQIKNENKAITFMVPGEN